MRTLALVISVVFFVPTTAVGQETVVSKRECQRLIRHSPSGDVAYKPGIDVRGRKVKPADPHGGSPIKLPKAIEIPITIDFAERYGFDGKGVTAESTLGKVTVKAGQAYWNGEPLNPNDQARIERACREAGY